jgi:hypothetical protein
LTPRRAPLTANSPISQWAGSVTLRPPSFSWPTPACACGRPRWIRSGRYGGGHFRNGCTWHPSSVMEGSAATRPESYRDNFLSVRPNTDARDSRMACDCIGVAPRPPPEFGLASISRTACGPLSAACHPKSAHSRLHESRESTTNIRFLDGRTPKSGARLGLRDPHLVRTFTHPPTGRTSWPAALCVPSSITGMTNPRPSRTDSHPGRCIGKLRLPHRTHLDVALAHVQHSATKGSGSGSQSPW